MWYVVQCVEGKEEQMITSLKRNLPDLCTDVFLFRYERMKKYGGEWHVSNEILFPGYVFMESKDAEELYKRLKQYPGIIRVLGEENAMIAVYAEEEAFLRKLCSRQYSVSMSKGYIKSGVTYVTEGPLAGYEKNIKKIDRHKRMAILRISLGKQEVDVKVGLEIVKKIA